MITADDVMTKEPRTVSRNDRVGRASELLRAMDVRHLPVVDAEQRPVGIVSERDLRGTRSDLVRRVMGGPVATAEPGTTLHAVALMMLEDRIGAIPIVDRRGRLIGIVTYDDVLAALPGGALDATAGEIMSTLPRTVASSAAPEEAVAIMQELGVRHVPVVDDEGNLVGILSDRDLGASGSAWVDGELADEPGGRGETVAVGELMSSDVESVRDDAPIAEVVAIMREERCGAVPVIDGESKVTGIVSYVDILRSAVPALELDAAAPTVLRARPAQRAANGK